MSFVLRSLGIHDLENLAPDEEALLIGNAKLLRDAGRDGELPLLLRGKHLGLLCDEESSGNAGLFRDAATALGARVSHIRLGLMEASGPRTLRDTARVMGRLYDAIECQGVPRELVRGLRAGTGVPVYDDISSPRHPTARLADILTGLGGPDRRSILLQTLLVSTIA